MGNQGEVRATVSQMGQGGPLPFGRGRGMGSIIPGRMRMDRRRADKIIERGNMRRRLYEWLWEETHKGDGSVPPEPCANLDGEQLIEELRAIILGK